MDCIILNIKEDGIQLLLKITSSSSLFLKKIKNGVMYDDPDVKYGELIHFYIFKLVTGFLSTVKKTCG